MVVLITGASAGIGLACAKVFAKNGYDVIITGRRLEKLQQLQEELEKAYEVKVLPLNFDIQDRRAVKYAIESLSGSWQKIDVLVNNAGLALGKEAFQDAYLDDFETMLQTNINGLLYVTKYVVDLKKVRKKGHIINISSTAAREVYPGGHVYCASKHAVDALTKGLRIDLLPLNIKVTSISPGMVETEFSQVRFKGDKSKAEDVYKGFTPLHADDVAAAVFYAASLPAHVCINDIVLTSIAQANSYITLKK
jgi:NADP-dependent 3-hydroxy acid dehydrogenase YdfG